MARWRAVTLWASLAVACAAGPAVVRADCPTELSRQLDRFTAHLDAWHRRCAAKTDVAACRDRVQLRAVAAATRAGRAIGHACAATPLFAAAPAGLGFPRSCAALAAGRPAESCARLPVTDARSLGECLLCWERADLDRLAGWVQPCGAAATACATGDDACRAAGGRDRRCLRAIAVAGLDQQTVKARALSDCVRDVQRGTRSGPCPDLRTELRGATALTRARRTVGACTRVPTAWAACRSAGSDVLPCDDVASLAGVTDCLDKATTLLSTASACRRFPDAAAHGVACALETTTTTATVSTSTSTGTSSTTTASATTTTVTSSTATTSTTTATASSTTAPPTSTTSTTDTTVVTSTATTSTTTTSTTSTTTTTTTSSTTETTLTSTTTTSTTTATLSTAPPTTASSTSTTTTTAAPTTTTSTSTTIPPPPECTAVADCDDDNPCTVDRCRRGVCSYSPVDFGDGNHCTNDFCDRTLGIVHQPIDPTDGDPCTLDVCDPATGIASHTPIPDCPPAPPAN